VGVCDSSLVNKKATFVWGRKKKGKKSERGQPSISPTFYECICASIFAPKKFKPKM
jgi:hypothetical protein